MKNIKFPSTKEYKYISKAYSSAKTLSDLIELCFFLLEHEHLNKEIKTSAHVLYAEITKKSYQSKLQIQ